jgi:hypothetical protein
MPVERNTLKQTSVSRKLIAYHQTWHQKILKEKFPRFQVLFITSTTQRVNNLIKVNKQLVSRGSGLFLFSDQESLKSQDFLTQLFLNGRGETVPFCHLPDKHSA